MSNHIIHINISEDVVSLEKGAVTVNVTPLYNKARKRLEKLVRNCRRQAQDRK